MLCRRRSVKCAKAASPWRTLEQSKSWGASKQVSRCLSPYLSLILSSAASVSTCPSLCVCLRDAGRAPGDYRGDMNDMVTWIRKVSLDSAFSACRVLVWQTWQTVFIDVQCSESFLSFTFINSLGQYCQSLPQPLQIQKLTFWKMSTCLVGSYQACDLPLWDALVHAKEWQDQSLTFLGLTERPWVASWRQWHMLPFGTIIKGSLDEKLPSYEVLKMLRE